VPTASVLSGITDAVTAVVGDYGLYAVFLLMLIDAVLPAASELVMVYGGALAAGALDADVVLFGERLDDGLPAYLAIALAGTIGYTLGSVGGWAIGLYGGRPFVERHGRWLHLDEHKLDRADSWFERFGDLFVAVGRVLPVVRSFVAVPAGIGRMPVGRYTALTVPGSAAWCFALAGVGWALGANWERFHHAFRYADYAVAALVVLAVAAFVLRGVRSRGRGAGEAGRRAEQSGVDPANLDV
jgi:membrane protein DedA with SNARE-associated domain